MGMGGGVGFVGRAFGGMAARNGATLTAESVASVAARAEAVSGTIAGDIADRSLGNYMPQMQGHTLKKYTNYRRPYQYHVNRSKWKDQQCRDVQHFSI